MTARLRRNLFRAGVPLALFAAAVAALVPAVRRVREAADKSKDL